MKRWYAVPTLAALAVFAACSDTSQSPGWDSAIQWQ
jgi:hypothetical protein